MNAPRIVSSQEWRAAREELLVEEKAHTGARDALAAQRRRMPMTPVEEGLRPTATRCLPAWSSRARTGLPAWPTSSTAAGS